MSLWLDEFQKKRQELSCRTEATLNNVENIAKESYRVADVARNSREILDDLERQFEEQTKLQGKDMAFLFLATSLQLVRIVIINNLTRIEKAGHGNQKEEALHSLQDRTFQNWKKKLQNTEMETLYYASFEHIITKYGVPYDATSFLTKENFNRIQQKGSEWDFTPEDFMVEKKLNLFKGANHRFSTLGHDPVIGLIFGTANIMTNTITCVKAGNMKIPVITTNHVVYTSDRKYPMIGKPASTIAMLEKAIKRTINDPKVFVAALIKQIIHIGTDLYTPFGIYLPGSNLILKNTTVERITKYISAGDVLKAGASAGFANLINLVISTFHTLLYKPDDTDLQDLYNIRTRKIITCSNVIASSSNVIWVGGNMAFGKEHAMKDLDIGGLMVIVHRLLTDGKYIREIKEDFVYGGLNRLILGDFT